jgi:hypothetical protein
MVEKSLGVETSFFSWMLMRGDIFDAIREMDGEREIEEKEVLRPLEL